MQYNIRLGFRELLPLYDCDDFLDTGIVSAHVPSLRSPEVEDVMENKILRRLGIIEKRRLCFRLIQVNH